MTKVLVETFIDKVIVYKDRVEVVFNFCKDISITQEIEDIVNFNLHSRGCDKQQQNTSDQGKSAILCDGGNTPLASTKNKSDTAGVAFYFCMEMEESKIQAPLPVADEGREVICEQ
ncbi:MAG: hypothetical protein ACM3S4_12470 [Burkholderiales bacterium]